MSVLSVELALLLRDAGLVWSPGQGDRFVLPGRGMDEQVFVLSDMTVAVHQLPRGRVVGFNGTTEWALDSVGVEEALWLPREDQLRDAGLVWSPGQGDRFVLSDMTVAVHQLPRGRVVGFNGTTEWALDSVGVEEALWLPREDQLRDLLVPRFVRLERAGSGWTVVLADPAEEHRAADAEDAYGRAVLRTLGG